MSTDRKYCEDCRFYRAPSLEGDYGSARCARPRKPRSVELIARAAKAPDAFCDMQRGGFGSDDCGPEAKFFELPCVVEAA